MKIPAQGIYALKALLELSIKSSSKSLLTTQQISQRQGIPLKFLTQILLVLKKDGYVQSVRGKVGGYYLIKKPSEITLEDIFGHYLDSKNRETINMSIVDKVMGEVNKAFLKSLKEVTLEYILKRYKSEISTPMYNI